MQIVTYLGVVETFDISAREACHEGHAHDTHSAEPRPGSISGAQSQGTSYDTLGENVVVVGRSLNALTRLSIVSQDRS